MGWLYTILAGSGELLMIWGLKQQHRFVVILALVVSGLITAYFLNLAFQQIDSSTVYPVWVSIGLLGSIIMGAVLYGEILSKSQLGWMFMLILGCIGLFVGGA